MVGETKTDALTRVATHGSGEVLFVGITPPRLSAGADGMRAAAREAAAALDGLDLDAVAVYDLADEESRDAGTRPFPFSPTLDPAEYVELLGTGPAPYIVYRNVGKYAEPELTRWLDAQPEGAPAVFVGAANHTDDVATTLETAYALRAARRPDLVLGAVTIPERHASKGDEPDRLLRKQAAGCSFFVTQIVYDVSLARRLVVDYVEACERADVRPAPIVFTLSLCGSAKQADLLGWLGVQVPAEVDRELRDADDTLAVSTSHCLAVARELAQVCRSHGLPFGFDVEALAGRPKEIAARNDLVRDVDALLQRG